MYQLLTASLLFAATSLAVPVPNPQLGVTLSTPIGGVAIGTPSVTNPAPPRPYYGSSSSYYPPATYPGVSVYPGALGSAIGDIASDVAYGIGDSIARGSGARPGNYDSSYGWNRPSSGYGYNSYPSSYNYGRGGWRRNANAPADAATPGEQAAQPQQPQQPEPVKPEAVKPQEVKPAEEKPAAAAPAQ